MREKLLKWADDLEQRAAVLQKMADEHASNGRAICASLLNAQVRSLIHECRAKRKRAKFGVTL